MLAAGDVATAAAWNVIANDVIDHETYIGGARSAWTSWTPVVTQGVSVAITSNSSAYLKLGSIVFVRCAFNVNASGTSSSLITITLPAALATVSGYNAYQEIGIGDIQSGGNRFPFFLQRNSSSTIMRLKGTNTTADDNLGTTGFLQLTAGVPVNFTGTWEVAP